MFKSMRLRKGVEDSVLAANPISDQPPEASLRRSNAKLRKRNKSSLSVDSHRQEFVDAQEEPAEGESFDFRIGEASSSRVNSWETNQTESLQYHPLPQSSREAEMGPGRYDAERRNRMSSKTGDSHKPFSKIFSKIKANRKNAAVQDNFTKWDNSPQIGRYGLAPHPSNVSSTTTSGLVAASLLGMNAAMAGQQGGRAARAPSFSNPYRDASLAQKSWADPEGEDSHDGGVPIRPKGKGKMSAIRDINWDDYESDEMLQALMASYSIEQPGPSPTDSGIGLLDEDSPLMARNKSSSSRTGNSIEEVNDIDKLLAAEARLQEEMAAQQRIWSSKIEALNRQKNEELERQRLEEEERQQSIALARKLQLERLQQLAALEEQLELDRLQQEEEDRIRAEALQEEERLAAQLAHQRECVCCGDTKDALDFPVKPATITCSHDSLTCHDCMNQWLDSEFQTKGTSDLKCPECPQTLSYSEIQLLASASTFEAYEKLLTRTALSSLDEFAWCLSPTCQSGQLNADNENFMDCVSCGYKQCLEHKVAWHTGETCEAYEYRTSGRKAKDEEKKTEDMLDTMSKKCPGKKCGWRIEKIDGCDHMTCKQCKFEFCWECLASHREIKKVGNTAHQKWCKFHSDNLETSWPFNVHA